MNLKTVKIIAFQTHLEEEVPAGDLGGVVFDLLVQHRRGRVGALERELVPRAASVWTHEQALRSSAVGAGSSSGPVCSAEESPQGAPPVVHRSLVCLQREQPAVACVAETAAAAGSRSRSTDADAIVAVAG